MFFRLLPEVYLTIGKSKSLLQNILDKKSLWIKNDLAYLLIECEVNRTISPKNLKIFDVLAKNNWGILSDKPIFIDKLRLVNVFNNKKFFKQAPLIQFATLKITDDCNSECEHCNTNFCPTCFHSGIKKEARLSLESWKAIILNLSKFGCKSILLTGGEPSLYPEIEALCKFIVKLGIVPTVYTNGKQKINLNNNTGIIISVNKIDDIQTIVNNYSNKKNILLLSHFSLENNIKNIIPTSWRITKFSLTEPKIEKDSLREPNIYEFFLQKYNNRCLNHKIAILENGDVYPCFGSYIYKLKKNTDITSCLSSSSFKSCCVGNTQKDAWIEIIKQLSKNFWDNTTDNNVECNNCEFRYSCNKCLFVDTKKNCNYDKENAVWK